MLKRHEKVGLAGLIALRDKLDTGWRPEETRTGICYQLYHYFGDRCAPSSYYLVRHWALGWPEHADVSEPDYPIARADYDTDTWAGSELAVRRCLIDYLIATLEAADAQ